MGKKSKIAENNHNQILQRYGKGFSRREIARGFGISDGPILRIIKSSGGKIRGYQDVKVLRNIEPSIEEKAVIWGTLLGDAYITDRGFADTATISWSYGNEDYAKFLNQKLKRICNQSFPKKYSDLVCSKCQKRVSLSSGILKCPKCGLLLKNKVDWRFQTKSLLSLRRFKDIIITQDEKTGKRRKTVTFDWLKHLTPLSLAIWYMDDGYRHRGSMWFCTDSFSYFEHKMFQNHFSSKWNLKTLIRVKRAQQNCYNLRIDVNSIDDFIGLIEPYIPKCMKYKLPSKLKPLVCSWCGEEFIVSRYNYGQHIIHNFIRCSKSRCKKLSQNYRNYKHRMKKDGKISLDIDKWKETVDDEGRMLKKC